MSDMRKKLGDYGEKLALDHYEQAGFKLLDRQFRCRFGEIDLILKKGNVYYFVEVRTKTGSRYGWAEESITPKKKQTIQKVSQYFLHRHRPGQGRDLPIQYDVVCIYINKKEKKAWLKRYPQAF